MSAPSIDSFLASRSTTPFDWTTANCCHFGFAWMEFATGSNPYAELPAVNSATSAMRLIKSLGGSLKDAMTTVLRREPVSPMLARPGDLVLIDSTEDVGAIGICAGRTSIFLDKAGTRVSIDTLNVACAWRLESA